MRLDAFVRAALPDASRTVVRRLIADGTVRVNGRPAPKGLRLAPGDEVVLPATVALEPEPAAPLVVLHEDARVLAVDKPGGVPGHALDPRERGTVAAALLARWPGLAAVGDPLAPGLVHRLDTGTSGVLVAARTAEAFAELRALFRAHAVSKRYVAVVRGAPRPGTRIAVALAHDTADRRRMVAARPGVRAWPAETTIVAVHARGDVSRIEVEIRTGVTHQVRAHLALAGHPVVGDVLYGGPRADALGPGRHALHAARIAIPSWPLAIEAPLPPDLSEL
jgi:23S rRNA pseudouridine1911/1915/1917 synthase